MNSKIIHEFYYTLGEYKPSQQYRLICAKETDLMFYGRAEQLSAEGKYVCDAGTFRIYQDAANDVELKTARGESKIMVRVDDAYFDRAKSISAKMARDFLRELADRLCQDEVHHPDLPISVGDTLYKLSVEPMGCHACPHGNQPMRHLCPYKCPENQFKIEEVVVDYVRTFLDIQPDGSIVLRDCYFKTRKIAEEALERKIRKRKENKLEFEKLEK